jgi:hypothetical protein
MQRPSFEQLIERAKRKRAELIAAARRRLWVWLKSLFRSVRRKKSDVVVIETCQNMPMPGSGIIPQGNRQPPAEPILQ